jgi:hypothetical protein
MIRPGRVAVLFAPCLLAISGGAHAGTGESTPYVEAGYAWPRLSSSGYAATAGAAFVRAGFNFDRYWALEAAGLIGTANGNISGFEIPITLKVKSAYGAFVKGQYPVAPQHFELFARAGWLHATVESKSNYYNIGASSADSSFAYGGGFQIFFGTGWYAQADYMSYYKKGGDTIRGPSIGIGYRFY